MKRWFVLGLALLAAVANATRETPSTRITSLSTSAGNKTASVNIPALTTTGISAFVYGYGVSDNQYPTNVALDSQPGSLVVAQGASGSLQIALYASTSPTTGSGKVFSWTNPVGYTALDGGLEYRDGILTFGTGPTGTDTDYCSGCNNLSTNALTTVVGDEMLCVYAVNGGTITGVGAGQSRDDEASGFSAFGFSSKTASGSSTTMSFSFSGGLQSYACVTIHASAGGGARKNPLSGPLMKPLGGPL